MTNDWKDLTTDEKADHLKERLDDIEARVEMQGDMVVGEDKLREELDSIWRVMGHLGFVDIDDDEGDE